VLRYYFIDKLDFPVDHNALRHSEPFFLHLCQQQFRQEYDLILNVNCLNYRFCSGWNKIFIIFWRHLLSRQEVTSCLHIDPGWPLLKNPEFLTDIYLYACYVRNFDDFQKAWISIWRRVTQRLIVTHAAWKSL